MTAAGRGASGSRVGFDCRVTRQNPGRAAGGERRTCGAAAGDPAGREPKLEPEVERSANVVQLSRRVSRWRRMTVVMETIAALLALYIVARPVRIPAWCRFGPRAPVVAQIARPRRSSAARLVAVLQQDPTAPAFLLTVDPQSRTLVVRRVSATPEAGPQLRAVADLKRVSDAEVARRRRQRRIHPAADPGQFRRRDAADGELRGVARARRAARRAAFRPGRCCSPVRSSSPFRRRRRRRTAHPQTTASLPGGKARHKAGLSEGLTGEFGD